MEDGPVSSLEEKGMIHCKKANNTPRKATTIDKMLNTEFRFVKIPIVAPTTKRRETMIATMIRPHGIRFCSPCCGFDIQHHLFQSHIRSTIRWDIRGIEAESWNRVSDWPLEQGDATFLVRKYFLDV